MIRLPNNHINVDTMLWITQEGLSYIAEHYASDNVIGEISTLQRIINEMLNEDGKLYSK